MIATIRKDGKRYVTKPVIPKIACTTKTTKNETKRLVDVITKLSEPISKRKAPIEATMLIAWSAKNDLHENTRRADCGLSGGGVATTSSSSGNSGDRTGACATFASFKTSGRDDLAAIGANGGSIVTGMGETAGAISALRWRTASRRN